MFPVIILNIVPDEYRAHDLPAQLDRSDELTPEIQGDL